MERTESLQLIGDWLRAARIEQQKSHRQLAAALRLRGVHASMSLVRSWESSSAGTPPRNEPSPAALVALAEVLEADATTTHRLVAARHRTTADELMTRLSVQPTA